MAKMSKKFTFTLAVMEMLEYSAEDLRKLFERRTGKTVTKQWSKKELIALLVLNKIGFLDCTEAKAITKRVYKIIEHKQQIDKLGELR